MLRKTLVVSAIISLFAFVNFHEQGSIPKKDRIALAVIADVAQEMKEKYGLNPIGHTIHKGFSHMGISFEAFGDFSREEIRSILLDGEKALLSHINEKKNFQDYASVSPMSHENVGVLIFFRDENGERLCHPKISIGEYHKGILRYRTKDPEKKYGYKETFEETLAEAVAIVKAQQVSIAQSN